jgi:hypothetical protein
MLTFNDLIINGVAQRNYRDIIPTTTETDNVVRAYNNSYGLFTDTHMSKVCVNGECEYIVTGSLFRDEILFRNFFYSDTFGLGTYFRPDGGEPMSLSLFLTKLGLVGNLSICNGDHVLHITKAFCPQCGDMHCTCVGQLAERPVAVATESLFKGTKNEIERFLNEAIKNDVIEFTKQLNESEMCNVDDFQVNGRSERFELYSPSKNIRLQFEI